MEKYPVVLTDDERRTIKNLMGAPQISARWVVIDRVSRGTADPPARSADSARRDERAAGAGFAWRFADEVRDHAGSARR